MKPSQVRAELLGEHFELRRLVEEARAVLRKGNEGTERFELRSSVARLADALYAHSQHEEVALRATLATIPNRAYPGAVMDADHVAEHGRLVAVLRTAGDGLDPIAMDEEVGSALDELESHMAEEEETLLGDDLLGEAEVPGW